MTARGAEGEARAVEGGVDGVKEPDDREQEDDVAQGFARESATGEQDGLSRVLDCKPRRGLGCRNEGNKVVGDVGSSEEYDVGQGRTSRRRDRGRNRWKRQSWWWWSAWR